MFVLQRRFANVRPIHSPVTSGSILRGLRVCGHDRSQEFALRDGDTIVFLGDSITAARTYGQVVENFTLLRFPDRKIRFINAGWGGDTATGGAARLERDVFSRGATVLTVAYGVNDIGWGLKADPEHKEKYLNGIRSIVSECVKRKVRVYICSAAITSEEPEKAEGGFLQKMCDEGMALARELGGYSIDVQRTMRSVQRKVLEANKKSSKGEAVRMHAADGVHLNELGQLAMGYAILKGLGAPAEVSWATVDFEKADLVESNQCQITEIRTDDGSLAFERLDEGLPINFGLFGALNFRFVPIPEELNRYTLTVKNLPPGKYSLTADGRGVGHYTAEQLGKGVNIASATTDAWQPGGPWDAQANALKSLTEARSQLATSEFLWKVQMTKSKSRPEHSEKTAAANAQLEELQRIVAKPAAYRFELKPLTE
jgi:lysophospholipase L1-like esterase